LTLVSYLTLMTAENKKRIATFRDDVKVLHIPWDRDRPNQPVDLERLVEALPVGGVYLRCDELKAYSHADNKGEELDGRGRVQIKARDDTGKEFWGTGATVHYDKEKAQLILEGDEGGPARLYQVEVQGAPPREFSGRKILYDRRTGNCEADGVKEMRGTSGGGTPPRATSSPGRTRP
jgi:hypothetical protein